MQNKVIDASYADRIDSLFATSFYRDHGAEDTGPGPVLRIKFSIS
jgi:hypothetical protein